MITVKFAESNTQSAYGLTQWDYGQVLQIEGLSLPNPVEVHFAEERAQVAYVQLGYTQGSGTAVHIPDKMLESGKDLRAYVYVSDKQAGETIKTIRLPVKRRQKPEIYSGEDADHITVEMIMEELSKKADGMKLVDSNYLQLMSGAKEIGDRIRLPVQEREIEIKKEDDAIKWRYTDSNEWQVLIPLADLRGPAGETPEFEIRNGHLFAMYKEE